MNKKYIDIEKAVNIASVYYGLNHNQTSGFRNDLIRAASDNVTETVKGRWIPPSSPYHWYKSTCSVCGYEDKQSGGDKKILQKYNEPNFCPNCGAQMAVSARR